MSWWNGGTWMMAMALALPAVGARGYDGAGGGAAGGGEAQSAPTYYEASLASAATEEELEASSSSAGALPSSLAIFDAAGRLEYRLLGDDGTRSSWAVVLEVDQRPQERVDAVYDLIVALPLPESFSSGWRIEIHEGAEGKSVPLVYGGEKVQLKRNRSLERSWLPILEGAASGLPSLAGSGYAWTLWDTILRHDPDAGDTLQALGKLQYSADAGVEAPDPGSAAFVINWIPTIGDAVPPFTLRVAGE